MKKFMKYAAAAAFLFGTSTAVFAQMPQKDLRWYVGAQVGAAGTISNESFDQLVVAPQFALQVGQWSNSLFGTRFHFMYGEQKVPYGFDSGYYSNSYNRFDNNGNPYKYRSFTADLDGLVNLTNLIWPNRTSHWLDWYGVAGFGVNYSFAHSYVSGQYEGHDWHDSYPTWDGREQDIRDDEAFSFNGRLGTGVNFNLSRRFALNVELQANYKNDLSNFRPDGPADWQFAAFAGVIYRLGDYKKKGDLSSKDYGTAVTTVNQHEAEEAERAAIAEAEAKKAKAAAERRKLEAEEARRKAEAETARKAAEQAKTNAVSERLEETIFFQIRESDPDAEDILAKVVEWSNKYPEKKITVTGYADKGTGTPAVNKKYAKVRAQNVAAALKAKGIPSKRLVVKSLGDTVQPFAENDQNRCTIIIGE